MDVKFVLLLYIPLIFAANTNKVDGEAEVASSSITNSSFTDKRSGGSEVVSNVTDSRSVDHSNNTIDNTQLSDEFKKKKVSDQSESSKKETMSNSSRKKERFHGEECDPSNMCTNEEDQFVACLRVPGNDAPHLSLLIQNKGKSVLHVVITAPSFVELEKKKVQLLENEDTKVKVSISNGGTKDSAIILTSSKSHCRLELKDFAGIHETGKDDTVAVSRLSILNIRLRTLILIFMIFLLVLSLVIIPMIIHVYRKKSEGNNKYQRLDMELPVSNSALVMKSDQETGGDDGWDNNWGDDWDDGDEEQPSTPVLPVTPSVSSRGLASRRLGKEGWKD